MNIIQYQQEVKRTCPDLGSRLLNSIHMTLGIGTEIFEELSQALATSHRVNISEELCDAQWYACNYATLYNIDISGIRPLLDIDLFELHIYTGRLQDFDKKELAYGKEVSIEQKTEVLHGIITAIETIALAHNIDMDAGRAKVIAKLKLRYPEKFTQDAAINRDTVAERKVLES
jgi:hypothetical protein